MNILLIANCYLLIAICYLLFFGILGYGTRIHILTICISLLIVFTKLFSATDCCSLNWLKL